jgi:hypothetical protein
VHGNRHTFPAGEFPVMDSIVIRITVTDSISVSENAWVPPP